MSGGEHSIAFDPSRSCAAKRADGPKSWIVSTDDLDEETFDLSVKNPNAPEAAPLHQEPAQLHGARGPGAGDGPAAGARGASRAPRPS